MAEQHHRPDADADKKLTVFGEPIWLDALKTLGVGLAMLLLVVVVGGALGVAIIAPWGRASHDCSIYCVLEQQFDAYFSDKAS
jgi:hypothetical protein